MVAPHLQGRAITVAMLGAPLALSLGIPAGTLLGTAVGWRLSFAIMTGLTVLLVTLWNVGIAGGGLAGGLLLNNLGVGSYPWIVAGLLMLTLYATVTARSHGFPNAG